RRTDRSWLTGPDEPSPTSSGHWSWLEANIARLASPGKGEESAPRSSESLSVVAYLPIGWIRIAHRRCPHARRRRCGRLRGGGVAGLSCPAPSAAPAHPRWRYLELWINAFIWSRSLSGAKAPSGCRGHPRRERDSNDSR